MDMEGNIENVQKRRNIDNVKPNLLFVFADQWRRQAMGCMSEDPVHTPNMDQFAGESLLFTNALSVCPICVPARASILTGRYPQNTKVIDNSGIIAEEETSIAKILNGAGYHTGYIGKWHLDGRHHKTTYVPVERRAGFQFWYANNLNHNHYLVDEYTDINTHVVKETWQIDHETEIAIDYIKKHRDQPFALFLSYAPPHRGMGREGQSKKGTIYTAPERYEAMYKDLTTTGRPNFTSCIPHEGSKQENQGNGLPGYFGAVTSMDDNFGRIMAFLEEEGLAENTIVVLHSDHGDMLGSHNEWGKKIWYEESIGVPFIIRWPKVIAPGRTDTLFNQVDIVPTLLGMMNIEVPETVDGTNFAALMYGEKMTVPDSAFIFYHGEKTGKHWRCIRTKEYSYVVIYTETSKQLERMLYHLKEDPYQMHPIKMGQGQDSTIQELEQMLCHWMSKTKDTFIEWLT